MVEPNYDNSKRDAHPHSGDPAKSQSGKGGGASGGASGGGASSPKESREFVLVKDDQRFVFRCAPGEEAQLLAQIAALVRDPANGLSWFDAAMLSQQITQSLGGMLKPS